MTDINAKTGYVYRKLLQTQKRLDQRRSDAQELIPQLQLLARCFDLKEKNCSIQEIGKNSIHIWDGEYKHIETPLNIKQIALDIMKLEEEVHTLQEDLDSLLAIPFIPPT